eukprot:3524672-Amphidinium_carterae.1
MVWTYVRFLVKKHTDIKVHWDARHSSSSGCNLPPRAPPPSIRNASEYKSDMFFFTPFNEGKEKNK